MDELLEQFLVESRELVAQAARDFAALAQDPRDTKAIDSGFRALHTLKGSFAIFALAPAERLLHGAEDLLEQARRGAIILQSFQIQALIACLDQIDRWIDAMEHDGGLPADADDSTTRILALFRPDLSAPAFEGVAPLALPQTDWLDGLVAREAALIAQSKLALTAFRYRPDPDCFFRGEDPLTLVEALPQIVALAILPTGGAWPDAENLEPFVCHAIIEGLSTADEADLRTAFRFHADQIDLAIIQPGANDEDTASTPRPRGSIRVEAARIDALAAGMGDLVVAVNRLGPLAEEIVVTDRAMATRLRAAQAEIERVTAGLHRHVARIRLVPLEPALRRLPRAAREMAQGLGKDIAFTLEGDGIEADKQIADGLFEPLLHLLRNAIDHGIEAPEERRKVGKPAQGQIRLALTREGDAILATLEDDGKGIDPVAIRERAIGHGLLDGNGAMPDDEATLRLIFEPGLSTAARVTDLSGRGVGMDAVLTAVTRLRGTIEVGSRPGTGTWFRLRFPAHALTTRLLVAHVGPERFGIPLDQIVETVRTEAAAIKPVGTGQALVWRGAAVPVLDLARLLAMEPAEGPLARLILTHHDGARIALRVDGMSETLDTVLRPPRGVLALAHGVMGSALLGDGSVLLVLDLEELLA
jgi:two-component system chemotaxis sensor kinase CheA